MPMSTSSSSNLRTLVSLLLASGVTTRPLMRSQEQHNHSKSTVSSSDTDVDSAEYASSSGTTTPEDEAQTFHLGATLHHAVTDKRKCSSREKLTDATRHRTLSSAVKRVKRVAHALVVFKKKVSGPHDDDVVRIHRRMCKRDDTTRVRGIFQKSDDMSPILISSPLRERFGKRMAVKPHPDEVCGSASPERAERPTWSAIPRVSTACLTDGFPSPM